MSESLVFLSNEKKKHGRPTVEKSRQHFSMFRKYLDPVRFFKRPNLCIAGRIIFFPSPVVCYNDWPWIYAQNSVCSFFFSSPRCVISPQLYVCVLCTQPAKRFPFYFVLKSTRHTLIGECFTANE